MVIRKSRRELDRMAAAGAIVAQTLALLRDAAEPGLTTGELDRRAEEFIRSQGGVPTFKGYHGFPGSICSSPNDMIVHGIPGEYELKDGDVLSIDVGVTYRGWIADSALTVPIGEVSDEARRLLETCRLSLFDAVEVCVPGSHLSDLGHAVQGRVEGAGFGVVRKLVGHGIGRRMHEDPQIPNYGPPGRGLELREGMVFAVEPMITAGSYEITLDEQDGWSIFTSDGSLASHFEHTVAVTEDGPRILTRSDGWSPVDEVVPGAARTSSRP
jgi:methionyl aminopeptidase